MRDHAVDVLAICTRKGQLVGTLTAFEIATRVTAESRAAELCDVDVVMTKQPIVCSADDEWQAVERALRERGEPRAIVLDDASRPVGMLTLADGPDMTSASGRTMPPPRGAIRFATASAAPPSEPRRLQQHRG
jgi:predicted transcriptional regulator